MQNGPHAFKLDHTGFCVFSKLFTQTFLIGRGDVTFLHVTYTKPSQNVGKLTCVHGRFKSPLFLWLIQILKAVTMIMVRALRRLHFLVKHGQPSHTFVYALLSSTVRKYTCYSYTAQGVS
jgi:hypothetical protein